jgi:hypothetical protein
VRVKLRFEQQAGIQVLLRDDQGDPAVAERVSFGLRGRSQDASLSMLDAVTDDEGQARVMLTAGDMAATFEVRVSAAGALDRHIGVAVSDSGFGSLRVDAPYAGRRDVRDRVIVVQADTTCEDHERSAGDPSFTLLGEQERAEFLALPAATRYAVAGFGQGPTGVALSQACVDGVEIDADRTTAVELTWSDDELSPARQMTLELELEAREPASWLRSALVGAARGAVTRDADGEPIADDAEARFLLDTLDATLRDDMENVELADAILSARSLAGGALESSLQSSLVVHDAGPLTTVDALAEHVVEALDRIGVVATVGIDEQEDDEYALSVWTMQVLARDDESRELASLPLSLALPLASGHARRVPDQDVLEADLLSLRIWLGALAAKVLRQAVEIDPEDDAEAPAAVLGCETLEDWLQARAIEGSEACDEACFADVCERAMVRLLAAAEPALVAVDEDRSELRLAGKLVLEDGDGDLLADEIEATELSGEWRADSDGDSGGAAVTGSGRATAIMVAE